MAARPAGVHAAVGHDGAGHVGDANHRHASGLCVARHLVSHPRVARRSAPDHDRRLAAALCLGGVAGPAHSTARARACRGLGRVVAAGGQSRQERQPDQLPVGSAGLRWPRRSRVALGLGRGRRRAGALLSRRSRVQRFCLRRAVPALARTTRWRRTPPRYRLALAWRCPVHRHARRCGSDPARRALPQPHAVDLADLLGGVVDRLAAGFTSPGQAAAAGRPPCRRRWCRARRVSRRTRPCPRRRRTGARPARWRRSARCS